MQMRYDSRFSILSIFSSLCRESENSIDLVAFGASKKMSFPGFDWRHNDCIFGISNGKIYILCDVIVQLCFMGPGSQIHGSWCFEENSWKCRTIYKCTLLDYRNTTTLFSQVFRDICKSLFGVNFELSHDISNFFVCRWSDEHHS